MTVDLASLWKPPCLDSLNEGYRLHRDNGAAWLRALYAYTLFVTSDALPVSASLDTLKLETARRAIGLTRPFAEQALTANGFVTRWSDEQCDAIAYEMADRMPRHPAVVEMVRRNLEQRRDEVFADTTLTHNDPLFIVHRWNTSHFEEVVREMFDEIDIEQISEEPIRTINRSLDYMDDLILNHELRPFIHLRRILTSLKRVHTVVLGD
ncbi:MAG: hypothetical protein ACK4RZ_11990 [Paracoccaceae bacterium]